MRTIRILNRDRQLVAQIAQWTSWRASRRLSEATELTVTFPREPLERMADSSEELRAFLSPAQPVHVASAPDPRPRAHGAIANYIEIWDGAQRRYTGRIIKRNLGDTDITLQCVTEEILLERPKTPAQYGRVWRGWDLADLARDVVRPWYVLRVADQSQWQAAVEAVAVDLTTEPGVVMLAKGGDGRYLSDGYITVRFRAADAPGFQGWDRIRWASDLGGEITTSMQYRYGADPANMGPWSDPIVGGEPDTLGVVPGTVDAAILDVRINLHTDDRESLNQNDQPQGQTPYVFAIEVIARQAAVLDTSGVPGSAGVQVGELEADNATALSVLREACEQAGWEFQVEDGALYLAQQLGQDRTSQFVFRQGTNCQITALGDEDAPGEWGNVLTAYGEGTGIARPMLVLRDEASIAAYGEVPVTQEFEAKTLADLQVQAQQWLEQHRQPKSTFVVRASFPEGQWPAFGVGDTVRVVDPRTGLITTARIMEETRSESAGGPLQVELRLNSPRRSLVDAILGAETQRPPAPPRNLRAVGEARGIRLYWYGEPPFEIQRADTFDQNGNPTNPFTLASRISNTSYLDAPLELGSKHAYRVRSLARGGSDWSAWAMQVARDVTPPAAPTGVQATSIIRGIAVRWAQPPEDDYAYTEVHISTTAGFTPDRTSWTTLKARVAGTAWEWTEGAVAGTTYYVRLVHVDTSGNASAPSSEMSVVAGHAQTTDVAQGAISAGQVYQLAVDPTSGTSTTSTSYVDIPNYQITFTLSEPALVYISGNIDCTPFGANDGIAAAMRVRWVLDGTPVYGSERQVGVKAAAPSGQNVVANGTAAFSWVGMLSAGSHTLKGQFMLVSGAGNEADVYSRILSVLILKR